VAVASAGPYASLHLAPDRQPHQHFTTQFLQAGCPSCRPTNSVKALEAPLQIIRYKHRLCNVMSILFQNLTYRYASLSMQKDPFNGHFARKPATVNSSLQHESTKTRYCPGGSETICPPPMTVRLAADLCPSTDVQSTHG